VQANTSSARSSRSLQTVNRSSLPARHPAHLGRLHARTRIKRPSPRPRPTRRIRNEMVTGRTAWNKVQLDERLHITDSPPSATRLTIRIRLTGLTLAYTSVRTRPTGRDRPTNPMGVMAARRSITLMFERSPMKSLILRPRNRLKSDGRHCDRESYPARTPGQAPLPGRTRSLRCRIPPLARCQSRRSSWRANCQS